MLVNTDLCNGLMPKGTKPLPEPKLTGIHEVLWHLTGKTQVMNLQSMFDNSSLKANCFLTILLTAAMLLIMSDVLNS